ncbi:MAG: TonB-dependent receptor [Marinilabiliales bacterium]|nr:MAG: TonB-dependent receptor [Marinilabiliales bacterium]
MFGVKHNYSGLKTTLFFFCIFLILLLPVQGNPVPGDPATGDPAKGDPATGDPATGGPDNKERAGSKAAGADSLMLLHINEVIIEEHRSSFFHEDKRSAEPDSLTMLAFSGSDLGTLLPAFTTAYINTPGSAGSAASLFLRGTNSYQSAISWNGFVLNSLTLGMADLSLVPVAAADEIKVVYGAAGSIAGSGNTGGAVLLGNRADWNNRVRTEIRSELGSYDNRHYSVTGRFGNPRIQYHINIFSHQAENDFRYTDIYKPGNPRETIANNALDNRGTIQNLFLRLPRGNSIEAGLWYQVREKQLPAIMGSYLPAIAVQGDNSVRGYAKWSKIWHRSVLSVNTAIFDETMTWDDGSRNAAGNAQPLSEITARRFMGDASYRVWVTDHLSADGGFIFSSLSASAGSYVRQPAEYRTAVFSAIKLALPALTVNTSARKEYHPGIDIPVLLSAGARYRLPSGRLSIIASYSDQFRVPTFNDKYWYPGGNPDLLPETGYSADAGLSVVLLSSQHLQLEAETGIYRSRLKNMIQWVPTSNNSWWHPENRDLVNVRGLEASVSAGGSTGNLHYGARAGYNYAKSMVESLQPEEGKKSPKHLRYMPPHSGSLSINAGKGRGYTGVSVNYTGNRHTTSDNNPLHMMPPFMVCNAWGGYRVNLWGISAMLQIRVMNLFNEQYQVVRSYAMPGRTFHLGLTLGYNDAH